MFRRSSDPKDSRDYIDNFMLLMHSQQMKITFKPRGTLVFYGNCSWRLDNLNLFFFSFIFIFIS